MKIGIIGFGRRLKSLALELAREHPEIEIAAVSDPSPTACAKAVGAFGRSLAVCESYQELLARPDIGWVMIGSPNHLHRAQAIDAMQAGKHVFCEKPLGICMEDCIAMRDAQLRTGVMFFIGFTLRYSPHYTRIKQIIEEGRIGRLVSMELNETLAFNHGGYIHQDWRRHTRLAGTHLLEKCCHDIDIANWLTGSLASRVASFGGLNMFTPDQSHHVDRIGLDPVSGRAAFMTMVEASGNPFTADKDIIDNQVAIIEYASGVRSTFHTNCAAAQPERRSYLVGTEGTIQADMISGEIKLRRIGWDTPTVLFNSLEGGSDAGHGGADPQLLRSLSRCILEGTAPRASIAEGMKSAVTCFAIDEAMKTGSVICLDAMWRRAEIDVRSAAARS